tara:strand:- start:1312 stop:3063 length:1752 start_codon:yes stop_codon:yes gene_type:complete
MGARIEVKYFNSFILRKIVKKSTTATPNQSGGWPGLPWNPMVITDTVDRDLVSYPAFPWNGGAPDLEENVNWYLEESRIKGGFNNTIMELGVRAYAVDKNPKKTDRTNSLIFSGIINDRTGINNTNVFSISENIIKDTDPLHGSIQKLFAEDTNLLVFQENKVHKALINKNTIYSGEQGAQEAAGISSVIGQLVPYLGEYGISRNPESFGMFGYRKYFVDKDRSAVLRLSRDGITEVSSYGMRDYFRDYLATVSDNLKRRVVNVVSSMGSGSTTTLTLNNVNGIDIGSQVEELNTIPPIAGTIIATGSIVVDIPSSTTVTISPAYNVTANVASFNFVTYKRDKIYGGWDIHGRSYTMSLQTSPRSISELIVNKEEREATFDTLSFDENIQGWTSFYSYQPIFLGSLKNKFYTFIDNEIYEHYAAVGANNHGKFYGATTPGESSIEFIFNPNPSVKKNFNTIAYEGDNGWEAKSIISSSQRYTTGGSQDSYQDDAKPILSYDEGVYTDWDGVSKHAGFDRKENRYVANIINNSQVRPGEIIFGAGVSGIKGYFTTVKFKIDDTTDVGGAKELFSVSSNYVMSSY